VFKVGRYFWLPLWAPWGMGVHQKSIEAKFRQALEAAMVGLVKNAGNIFCGAPWVLGMCGKKILKIVHSAALWVIFGKKCPSLRRKTGMNTPFYFRFFCPNPFILMGNTKYQKFGMYFLL